MNPESDMPQPSPREMLEERVVALILGELSENDEAEVRGLMKADASLNAFHDEMAAAIGIVQEAHAGSATATSGDASGDQSPKFDPERRQALLADLTVEQGADSVGADEIVEEKEAEEKIRRPRFMSVVVRIAAALAVVGLGATLLIPNFVKARRSSPKSMAPLMEAADMEVASEAASAAEWADMPAADAAPDSMSYRQDAKGIAVDLLDVDVEADSAQIAATTAPAKAALFLPEPVQRTARAAQSGANEQSLGLIADSVVDFDANVAIHGEPSAKAAQGADYIVALDGAAPAFEKRVVNLEVGKRPAADAYHDQAQTGQAAAGRKAGEGDRRLWFAGVAGIEDSLAPDGKAKRLPAAPSQFGFGGGGGGGGRQAGQSQSGAAAAFGRTLDALDEVGVSGVSIVSGSESTVSRGRQRAESRRSREAVEFSSSEMEALRRVDGEQLAKLAATELGGVARKSEVRVGQQPSFAAASAGISPKPSPVSSPPAPAEEAPVMLNTRVKEAIAGKDVAAVELQVQRDNGAQPGFVVTLEREKRAEASMPASRATVVQEPSVAMSDLEFKLSETPPPAALAAGLVSIDNESRNLLSRKQEAKVPAQRMAGSIVVGGGFEQLEKSRELQRPGRATVAKALPELQQMEELDEEVESLGETLDLKRKPADNPLASTDASRGQRGGRRFFRGLTRDDAGGDRYLTELAVKEDAESKPSSGTAADRLEMWNRAQEEFKSVERSLAKRTSGGAPESIQSDLGKLADMRGAAKQEAKKVAPKPKPAPKPKAKPNPEIQTEDNAFSTFSLNVSDVSFKLAAASLEKNQMPEPASVRSEEFVNAFNYRDPAPTGDEKLSFAWEQAGDPFQHNRNLIRFSIQTAAIGRAGGQPLNVVVLLDNSGSMERSDRLEIVRRALRTLVEQMTPIDRISIVAFARTPRLWVDGMRGGNPDRLVGSVLNLTPQGGTNLEAALDLGYQVAQKHFLPNGNNRVILLTDGAANLGDVDPERLKARAETQRKRGIALDCFGIGWEGYNDELLENLTRNADGRYGFINRPAEADEGFADQLAGALRVAASNVKAQVEFNPRRVISFRQIGYEKHQLKKEQFRDNTVDAAEIGAAESGTALYSIQVNHEGDGPLGVARIRFMNPATGIYEELEWPLPYRKAAPSLADAAPSMRLAGAASAFAEWLARSPYAGGVTPAALQSLLNGVPEYYANDARPKQLTSMIRQARQLGGVASAK